ncbi:glucosaminidase domain-containing protein, partial [[Clostridium] spiroforme]|nr:glucosaminidase domain-containing protein [Thomasclavelia spiroformis]
MKKKSNILGILSITCGLTIGNAANVYAIENIKDEDKLINTESNLEKENINSEETIDVQTQSTENSNSNNEEVDNFDYDTVSNEDTQKEVIGQTSYVDENGNITTVDVYDGTTGEEFNPYARVVTTANMVNFNCNKAGITTSYIDVNTGQAGYLSKASAADAAYLGMENGKVKFMISGVVGLVDPNLVEVVTQGTYYASNYEVNSSGKLYHYISNNVNATGNEGNKNYVGVGPSYLKKNTEYYSYDGHYFYADYNVMINDYKNNVRTNSVNPNNPYYNYFQYLPLRSKTNYTGSQITTYLNNKANSSTSKLNNTGDYFVKYQNQYGVNALLAASFAALESGWGKSSIAQNKNNLFGLNATDNNPSANADTYPSVENCIYDFSANWMSLRYLNPKYTSLFRGGYFGDKGSGIFGKYSSDPYEGEKCASIAANMDAGISNADKNYYNIGIKDATGTTFTTLNVRAGSSITATSYYTTIKNPSYAFLITNKTGENGFYQIQNELPNSDGTFDFDNRAYVSGQYINIVNKGNDLSYVIIKDVKTTNITRKGYTVTCTIRSDTKVTKVKLPTWTEKNGQDDLEW